MSFQVGQKVVCVSAVPHPEDPTPEINPVLGGIYTISEIILVAGDRPNLNFHESFWPGDSVWLAGWDSKDFRPLIERKTDTGMAILRKVADDAAKRKNLVVTG